MTEPTEPEVLEVPIDPGEPPPEDAPLLYEENAVNLVFDFEKHEDGKKALKTIARRVLDTRSQGLKMTEEYRADCAKMLKLFEGWTPPKPPPFDFGPQPVVPILIENVSRHYLRAYLELFGGWNDVFSVDPIGPDDVERAQLMTLHDNFQIRHEIPDFRIQHQKGLLQFFLIGDVTSHSFWSDERCENRHEMLGPDEYFIPYVHTQTMPDYSDCPWRFEIQRKYRHEVKKMDGHWFGVTELLDGAAPTWMTDSDSRLLTAHNELTGVKRPAETDDAPYELVLWEGWLELPGQSRDRFCQVIVEVQSNAVLLLKIWEEQDWRDAERFQAETAEREAYSQALELWVSSSTNRAMAAEQASVMMGVAPDALPPEALPPEIPEPPRPKWMGPPSPFGEASLPEPRAVRMVPISMYVHGRCVQSLKGALGIGMGKIITPHHVSASMSMSAFFDAAALGNGSAFIVPSYARFDTPDGGLRLAPGYVNRATNMGPEDIERGIKEIRLQQANDQLLMMVDRSREYGESAMHSRAVLSGEGGKSGETYRGLATRVEQAGKPLSAMAGIYWDFTVGQLQNNARLNSIYLPETTIKDMVNSSGLPIKERVDRSWWKRDYHISLRSDLRFVSQAEKIAEADEELNMVLNIPELYQNPVILKYALEKAFKSRGCFDIAKQIGPAIVQSMQMRMQTEGPQQPMNGQPRPPAPSNGGQPGRLPAVETGAPPV